MIPEKTFFMQFPGGCPSCGGPKRYMSFNALVKRPRMLKASGYAFFAECEACHEAFVWSDDARMWVNAKEVGKGGRHRAITESEGERNRRDGEIDIGKVY